MDVYSTFGGTRGGKMVQEYKCFKKLFKSFVLYAIFSDALIEIEARWGFQTCQSRSGYVFPLSALTHCCFSNKMLP